jgi:Fe-S-cluster containining protein
MRLESAFSYRCGQCGRCCHDKVITLSPYDVMRMARATGLTTGDLIARFTIRRGSLLKFGDDGACAAIVGASCSIHGARPLSCRLYPLGMERTADGMHFVKLEPMDGSLGVYGDDGTIADFLRDQDVEPYFEALSGYRELLDTMKHRIAELADFEKIDPREFRRRAVREALAESGFDPNPLIDALFDSDQVTNGSFSVNETIQVVERHIDRLKQMTENEKDSNKIAAAAVSLAVSLGYAPADAFPPLWQNS